MIGVTGSSGFVASSFIKQLNQLGLDYHSFSRSSGFPSLSDPKANYRSHFSGISTLVICSGLAHVPSHRAFSPNYIFEVNAHNLSEMAKQALDCGVKHLIYISSLKVYGSNTSNLPITLSTPFGPADTYAKSKLLAESLLLDLVQSYSASLTIIRPPLIYGPNPKANFKTLVKLVSFNIPLPLLNSRAYRSLMYVDNLSSLILHMIFNPPASTTCILASDGHPVSVPELVSTISTALRKPKLLLPFPPLLAKTLLSVLGLESIYNMLFTDFVCDSFDSYAKIGFTPPFSFERAISLSFGSGITLE